MRAVIQRVSSASVTIDGKVFSVIEKGLLILIGIEEADNNEDIDWLCKKIIGLRIFSDTEGLPAIEGLEHRQAGKMNFSVRDVAGEILVVSQFTLHASTKKGNRPSYLKSAKPDIAIPFYDQFCAELSLSLGNAVKTGVFGANMKVSLVNDGPVTLLIDTKNKE